MTPSPLSVLVKRYDWIVDQAQPWQWQNLPGSVSGARQAGSSTYYTGKPCLRGHRSYRLSENQNCAMCMAERRRGAPDQEKEKQRKAFRDWRARNIEEQRARERGWHAQNPEISRAKSLRYNRENAKKVCAAVKAAASRVRQATPAWADKAAIREFYFLCPDGMHVDHIVPIKGKNVCGLHVINNFQYLSASENCSKGNKFDG
jgi:hypothetical protein